MYDSYEYYLKGPPSLFGSRQIKRLIQQDWHRWLREFAYIAIFPVAIHVQTMFEILRDLHGLEVLTVKFGAESNEFFPDLTRRKCHFTDLWAEFHDCYYEALLFAHETSFSHRLKLFRSLDWRKYAGKMELDVEMYLPDWTFCDDSWRKPTRENETGI